MRPERLRVGSWPGRGQSLNPFVDIFCDAVEGAGATVVDVAYPQALAPDAIDVLHIHWPERVFWQHDGARRTIWRTIATLRAIRRLRARGVAIVWLVHNLRPHDADLLQAVLWTPYSAALARMTDAVVTLSPATLGPALGRFAFRKDVARLAVRHPPYPVPPPARPPEVTRDALGLPAARLNLAFVGMIRPYKGVAGLARIVSGMPGDRFSLVAAGQVKGEALRAEIAEIAERSGNVMLIDRRVDDAEFADLVRAADYVVLPFDNSLHSGSLVHALSLARPVLTTRTPYAEDLARVVGPEWVRLFDPPLTAEHLAALPPSPQGAPDLGVLAAETMGRELVALYRSLGGTGAR